MKTIHKYPLHMAPTVTIDMPDGADVLSVEVQRGLPCIWARVDTSRPLVKRRFDVIGTGHKVRDDELLGRFVGTFLLEDGALVFHLFELQS